MQIFKALAIVAAAFAVSPAWAINKCTQPNGSVVFQDAACPDAGARVADDMAKRKAHQELQRSEAAKVERKRLASQQKRLQACKGKIQDEPSIGMSVSQWQNCTDFWDVHGWGSRVNETETAAGKTRQHVFETRSIKYIYTTNGVITAIQR